MLLNLNILIPLLLPLPLAAQSRVGGNDCFAPFLHKDTVLLRSVRSVLADGGGGEARSKGKDQPCVSVWSVRLPKGRVRTESLHNSLVWLNITVMSDSSVFSV